jgi:hypothetical protein
MQNPIVEVRMSGRADMRVGEHGTIDVGNAQSEPEARVTDDWPAAYE